MRNLVSPGLALGLALGSGCYAGVESFEGADGGPNGSPGDDGAEDDGADDEGEPASQCGADPAPGASPIRRLSAWEYDNTIFDLLGDDSHPSAGFPQEGGSGFDNNADVSAVTRLMAQKYLDASEGIAARAVAELGALLPCDPAAGAGERACIEQWVDGFGLRAWRRPLTADERTAMLGLYDEARAIEDLPTATGLVLQAFLQSPHFLYRVELGIPGEQGTSAVRLGGHEMASRLSYFLWGSMPDDALLEAAAAGGLVSADDVEAQARRMLDDPKARRMVEHFHEQWLGTIRLATLEKDTTVFPAWSPELSAKQVQEALALVDHVFFEGEGTLEELLTAPYTFVDAELAAFYGLPVPVGTGLRKTEASGGIELSGILSLGGVLSAHALADTTDPIKRGLFVREHLLCQIPPPPPDVIPELPPVDPNATTRERFEQHRSDPVCAACHTLFDPIGFGFENYDAVGRWRTTENDLPIDASGELTAADVAGEFVGVRELGGKLAASEDVAECVSRQWFRFAYGRLESEALDACNMETLTTIFAESGHDLRELLVALTQTDAFMFRTAYADEGGE